MVKACYITTYCYYTASMSKKKRSLTFYDDNVVLLFRLLCAELNKTFDECLKLLIVEYCKEHRDKATCLKLLVQYQTKISKQTSAAEN